jgi:uncharacterized Ntn-hydrolase superfamily protein
MHRPQSIRVASRRPGRSSARAAAAIAPAILATLLSARPLGATYSIVARDPDTGQVGAAVQSHWFQVSNVIWVEPGVGAVATQSLADFTYGPAALELLRRGRSATKTLEGLLASDDAPHYRQVAILDLDGEIAAHTGASCIAEAGHSIGEHYSVQANLMKNDTVPGAMARAFEEAKGDLAERLMTALEAAEAEGGDVRGKQSAALLVAGTEDTGRPWADLPFDLRVDDHTEPVRELRRILEVARAYRSMNEGDLAIESGDFAGAEAAYGRAAELAPGNPEVLFWYGVSLANAGRLDAAVEVMTGVYELDGVWRALPARIERAGLLEGGEDVVRRLENAGNGASRHGTAAGGEPQGLHFPGEDRLANVRQLTFGGQNAEAYWSENGERLIFQATPGGEGCDQIFTMRADGSDRRLVSTGKGRTTCSYFLPGTGRVLYSSTHHASPDCPPPPDYSRGYVWPILADYEIWTANRDGTGLERLTRNDAYDAEATVSADGSWIVFTSTRDGDLDLYKMRPDGSGLTRLTDEPGYDGGAFFSRDGSKIVYRASRPADGEELADYRALLAQGLIRPGRLEIFWMNANGTGKTQVTRNGAANFAPYFTPDGERILFASNVADPKGRDFDLYLVALDGSGLERVTFCPSFDSFPMFSPDGTKLAFASNRNGSERGETNIFVADWIEK